jgi:CubicO group peptidase (beta-lactamase class C family)
MQRLSTSRLARLTAGMAAPVERGEIPGLVALVARGEDVHVEVHGKADLASGAPMRRDTIFRIASVSKPITAVAAMMLVEEAILRLDEPVTTWLPELADITVLRRLDGPIDDVVSAARAITVRDLLTFRMGLGAVMAAPGTYPIQAALAQASLAPGPSGPQITPDAWIAGLGRLPLIHQPGEQWMYHTGSDVLGLLIARASGMSLGDFLRRRLFEPLGMKDTGFSVPAADIGRLSTAYVRAPGGGFEVFIRRWVASGPSRQSSSPPGAAWSPPPTTCWPSAACC